MEVKAFQKYPAYKDSGVKWLGDIPEYWMSSRLGSLLMPVSERNSVDLPLLSITREKGVILRDLDNEDENHNFIPDDLSNYKVLRKGQFGMNKMKAWQGSYGISQFDGIVSPAYFIFKLGEVVDPAFFHRAIRSRLYISFFGSASDGVRIGQWDLSKPRMKEIPFFFPPLPEQTAIAHFLDTKTEQIDRAIAQKEKLIALLKERKQIVIQQAVTKGLDKTVKLKHSGVEWIGEIPEEWVITKAKYYSKIFVPERSKPELNNESIGLPWVTTENIRDGNLSENNISQYVSEASVKKAGSRIIKTNSVIATCVGNFGVALKLSFDCIINQQLQGYCDLHINPDYLTFLIRISSDYFKNNSTLTTIMYVSKETFGCMPITVPSIDEQTAIVTYIETQSAKIDKAITLQEQQIEKLKEYKAVLVDSAVTGKIKVSNYD